MVHGRNRGVAGNLLWGQNLGLKSPSGVQGQSSGVSGNEAFRSWRHIMLTTNLIAIMC